MRRVPTEDIVLVCDKTTDRRCSIRFWPQRGRLNAEMDVRAEAERFLSFVWSVRPGPSSRC